MPQTAFEKRVKRRVIARPHEFFAACSPGLEPLCRQELEKLDADIRDIRVMPGGAGFSGRLQDGYRANLCLRSPSRILMRLGSFKAVHFGEFEKGLQKIDWELYLPAGSGVDVRVSCRQSRLYHSDALTQKSLGLIQEKLEQAGLPAPPGDSSQTVMIRGEKDRFQVSLDMSGALLFKRGVKPNTTDAPLRETLAFAVLTATGFSPDDLLLDPMCGSGTFSIEGAMIKSRVPPGIFRSFAFETWPGFRPENFNFLKTQLKKQFKVMDRPEIFASDSDEKAVDAVNANISAHDFLRPIHVRQISFFDINCGGMPTGKGVVILNPPYGKRLESAGTLNFYREIGRKLRSDFKGWRTGIICPDQRTWKALDLTGLHPGTIFNGGLHLILGTGII